MNLPSTETLTRIKTLLEVIVLLLIVPLLLYTASKDSKAAAALALGTRK